MAKRFVVNNCEMDEREVETIIDLDVGGTRFRTTRQTL